jgi:hypothetical protein
VMLVDECYVSIQSERRISVQPLKIFDRNSEAHLQYGSKTSLMPSGNSSPSASRRFVSSIDCLCRSCPSCTILSASALSLVKTLDKIDADLPVDRGTMFSF